MTQRVLVRSGSSEFYVELANGDGAYNVSTNDQTFSFDEIGDTISTIAEQIACAWEKVKPTEASIEFGLKLTAKSGKLIGILVDGSSEASLKVTLKWTSDL